MVISLPDACGEHLGSGAVGLWGAHGESPPNRARHGRHPVPAATHHVPARGQRGGQGEWGGCAGSDSFTFRMIRLR